jgi:hypothetical protein
MDEFHGKYAALYKTSFRLTQQLSNIISIRRAPIADISTDYADQTQPLQQGTT